MRRTTLFGAAAGVGLVTLAAVTLWYLGSYQTHGGSISGMMGQMMGGSGSLAAAMPWSVWLGVVAMLGLVLVGAVGLGYYAAFPEIKSIPPSMDRPQSAESSTKPEVSWSTLVKTSTAEEKKVLEVLAAHEGHYLQKFVVKETGLSKLKIHRIVSRFAERGVVSVVKSGNTNEVSLASWVREGPKAPD